MQFTQTQVKVCQLKIALTKITSHSGSYIQYVFTAFTLFLISELLLIL